MGLIGLYDAKLDRSKQTWSGAPESRIQACLLKITFQNPLRLPVPTEFWSWGSTEIVPTWFTCVWLFETLTFFKKIERIWNWLWVIRMSPLPLFLFWSWPPTVEQQHCWHEKNYHIEIYTQKVSMLLITKIYSVPILVTVGTKLFIIVVRS